MKSGWGFMEGTGKKGNTVWLAFKVHAHVLPGTFRGDREASLRLWNSIQHSLRQHTRVRGMDRAKHLQWMVSSVQARACT